MNGQEFPEVGYEENGYRWTGQDWEPATAPMPVIDTSEPHGGVSTDATLGRRDGSAVSGLAMPEHGTSTTPGSDGEPKRRGRRAANTPPPPPEVGTVYNGFRWDGHSWMPDTPLRPNLSAEARAQATAAFEAQRFAQSTSTRTDNRRAPLVILGLAVVALMGAAGLLLAKAASNKSQTDSANVQRPPTERAALPSPTMSSDKAKPEPDAAKSSAAKPDQGQQPPAAEPTAGTQKPDAGAKPPANGGVQPKPPANGGNQPQPPQGNPKNDKPAPTQDGAKAPQPAVGRVGQPLTSGTTQLIVTSVRQGLSVPGGIQPQGRWLVADLVVTNFGKDPVNLTAGTYAVALSSGQTIPSHAQAMANSRSPLITTLVSGKSTSGTVYFDVPKDAVQSSIVVSIPGTGKMVVNV